MPQTYTKITLNSYDTNNLLLVVLLYSEIKNIHLKFSGGSVISPCFLLESLSSRPMVPEKASILELYLLVVNSVIIITYVHFFKLNIRRVSLLHNSEQTKKTK